ncbi:hypothetical protein PTET_a0228 [Pseudoalteromonas tetraodonis]|nr:hypothetical protein PTET_a0228 [Pseudoalteromonas tetraodonis]
MSIKVSKKTYLLFCMAGLFFRRIYKLTLHKQYDKQIICDKP